MPAAESRELLATRRLLSEFESDMGAPEAVARLSDALEHLVEVLESGPPEDQIARNVAGVYAGKCVKVLDAILNKPGEVAAAELLHWQELLGEFGRAGIESPPVEAALGRISRRLATRHVAQMTDGEKAALLRKLEEEHRRKGRGRS